MKDFHRKFAIKLNLNKLDLENKDKLLAKQLKALSHPIRLSILRTLMEQSKCPHGSHPCSCGVSCEGENCKCGCKCGTFVEMFDLSQSTISQHIKELKSAGLIEIKSRKGEYRVNHSKLKETFEMLRNIFHLPLDDYYEKDNCSCCQ
ncbi:MAG: helix-turn-helix transcriptional regulator [Muribaculaceae bacterium]|nr:helix-turn-helix transcriptional regulator [Muribaculaceae bacterium]